MTISNVNRNPFDSPFDQSPRLERVERIEIIPPLVRSKSSDDIHEECFYSSEDPRINLHEVDDLIDEPIEKIKEMAKSIGCFVDKNNLIPSEEDPTIMEFRHDISTLKKRIKRKLGGYSLAREEKFREEVAPGIATVFLIANRIFLTAGHCVTDEFANDGVNYVLSQRKINSRRIVMGFNSPREGEYVTSFAEHEMFSIKKVLDYRHMIKKRGNSRLRRDWALIEVNESTERLTPIKMHFEKLKEGDEVYTMGHPTGLPLKIAMGATIKKTNEETGRHIFLTDVAAFGGNSGSPVFLKTTNKVCGIIVRGPEDHFGQIHDYNTGKTKLISKRYLDDNPKYFQRCTTIKMEIFSIFENSVKIEKTGLKDLSNNKSKLWMKSLQKNVTIARQDELCNRIGGGYVILTGVVILPLLPLFGYLGSKMLDESQERVARQKRKRDRAISIHRKVNRRMSHALNVKEASLIQEFLPKNLNEAGIKKFKKIAQMMCVYEFSFAKAKNIYELKKASEKNIKYNDIFRMMDYQKSKNISLSFDQQKQVLEYLKTVDEETNQFFTLGRSFEKTL